MGDHGIRSNHAAHARGGGPKRQVSVLPVDEEPRIESAELSPELARDEQQAARNDVHVANRVALPTAE